MTRPLTRSLRRCVGIVARSVRDVDMSAPRCVWQGGGRLTRASGVGPPSASKLSDTDSLVRDNRLVSPPAPSVVIEPERPQDAEAVREVVRLAFAPDERVHALVDLIRDSPEYVPGLSLVARDPGPTGEVVGHVMLSYSHIVG